MISLEEIKRFFFRASIIRWTESIDKMVIPELSDSIIRIFTEGDLKYCHLQFRGEYYALGNVIIWHKGIPIWNMVAGGFNKRDIFGFSERAFLSAYRRAEFLGGRGPARFTDADFPGLEYRNHIEKADFEDFYGREEISKNGHVRGSHWYRGGIL